LVLAAILDAGTLAAIAALIGSGKPRAASAIQGCSTLILLVGLAAVLSIWGLAAAPVFLAVVYGLTLIAALVGLSDRKACHGYSK
jgi:hypothetical protein